MVPGTSQGGDGARARYGRARVFGRALPNWRPSITFSPFALALALAAAAVVALGALTYYGAREFSGRAADRRAAEEATSLARHSATLATGDAFDGYLQILRYAEDPAVRDPATPREERRAAMWQLLFLNTNDFVALAVADNEGRVLASTDPAMEHISGSPAYLETRASDNPANSDIIVPEPGKPGYVEFTAALHDTDGSVWGIIFGRADPERLWRSTLKASVDGSHNIIINNQGMMATGVPVADLGSAWAGRPANDGSVRATIAGVDSICGLGPIGESTRIDRGWHVAACLPASLIQAQNQDALDRQELITVAGAVLIIALAAAALRAILAPRTPVLMLAAPAPAPDDTQEETPAAPSMPPAPAVDVDAIELIRAYEKRNARLGGQLRDAIKARLLIVASQEDEAFRLAGADDDLARTLHDSAMEELERVREVELRTLGDELHPEVVRLGLPAALKALRRNLEDLLSLRLDIDPRADPLGPADGQRAFDESRRLILYRLALESVRLFAAAGARSCVLTLVRTDHGASISLEGPVDPESSFDVAGLDATRIAVDAYGGTFALGRDGARVAVSVDLPLPAFHGSQSATFHLDPPAGDAGAEEVDPLQLELEARLASIPDRADEDGEDTDGDEQPPVKVVKVTLDEVLAADSVPADDDGAGA